MPFRYLWWCLGLLMLMLGLIGAFLPVMPITIFLILAASCFSRSSARLQAWLLGHLQYGPSLRLWREQGAINRKGKCFAAAGMTVGYALFWWGARPDWKVAVVVGLFVAASAAYVLSRPAPRLFTPPLRPSDERSCRQPM